VHSETQLFNMETHEFGSNHFHFATQKLREQLEFKYKN
jgi:hypothetical protein